MEQRRVHQEQQSKKKNVEQQSSNQTLTKNFQTDEFDQKTIFLCQFCGGKTCTQEDFLKNKKQPNAVEGLHSNWITDGILAMQRPSQRIIKQFSIYTRFKNLNINTILNLQQPGEHAYCGDGIIPKVGFSYIPQGFFAQGILFFNQSWEDMTATTFEHMMKIMNVFHLSLIKKEGKISVHCHAGRGRTLLVICSWLIYHNRMTPQQTINLAIEKREGVLTRASQRTFLFEFENQLRERWKSFNGDFRESFQHYVEWQTTSLLKSTQIPLKHTSYLHGMILQQFRKRLKNQSLIIALSLVNTLDPVVKQKTNPQINQNIKQLKEKINTLTVDWQSIDTVTLTQLLSDYYDSMPYTIINTHTMDQIFDQQAKNKSEKKIEILTEPAIVHDIGIHGIAVILDFVSFCNSLKKYLLDKPKQIIEGLFLRVALLLFSKQKFHNKIFNIENRQYEMISEKSKKYINGKIKHLSSFLYQLSLEIPSEEQYHSKILLKFRKIDANLHYYTENHRKQNKTYQKHQSKEIFTQAKLNNSK